MPSLASNNSINCCISHEPPSPDALSPRPAVSPRNFHGFASNKVLKDLPPIPPSPSVADARPAGLVDQKPETSASKRDSSPISDDSDLPRSNDPDNAKAIKARMSRTSLNLKAVTNNLKKHLSRDSTLNKRRSRSSVGQSEEEVERRAELRRIRRKRIQEELRDKDICDDGTDSCSAATNTPNNQTPCVPEAPFTPPSLKLPQLSLSALSLPIISPSAREHNLTTPIEHTESLVPVSTQPTSPKATRQSSAGTISRRHSSPILEPSFADPRVYLPSRKLSYVPPTPATPNTRPLRLPTLPAPEKSSWRLTFKSSNRAEELRKLSMEHVVPSISSSDLLNATRPATRKWLHSQGLISSSRAVESSSDLDLSTSINYNGIQQDFGGVDGPYDPSSEALVKAIAPPAPASDQPQESTALPNLPKLEPHHGRASDSRSFSQILFTSRLITASGSVARGGQLPSFREENAKEDNLSCLSSTDTSIQHCRKPTRFSLISLLSGKKSRIQVNDPFDVLPAGRLLANKVIPAVDDGASGLTAPSTPYARRSTIDDSSILASETESYREREAELKVVQARFASADARRISTPRSSKFREEFAFASLSRAFTEHRGRKQSTFARLTRFATRNYDGASAMEDLLAVPMPDFNIKDSQSRNTDHLNQLAGDSDVSAQWERAAKSTADERAKELGNRLEPPAAYGSFGSRKGSSLSTMGWRRGGKSKKGNDKPLSAAAQYKKQFEERLAVKEMVMADWEAEMEASAQKAKAKSRNMVKKIKVPTNPDRRFPLGWSQFPSHTRTERCLSAGVPDQVEQHDFAMRISDHGERVFHQCRQAGDRHLHDDEPDWHEHEPEDMGLTARIGDKISQAIYHLEVHGGGSKPFEFQTGGRRGSMIVSTKLEFPELELLPVSPKISEDKLGQEGPFEQELAMLQDRGKKSVESRNTAKSADGIDSVSHQEDLVVSISDPKFYDDCLVFTESDRTETPFSHAIKDEGNVGLANTKRSRSMSWHGRGKKSSRARNMSLGAMALRASTDDYCDELVRMEKEELEKLLCCTTEQTRLTEA